MHLHLNSIDFLKTGLYVIVFLGTLNLLAMRFRDSSSLAASWCNLFGLDSE